MKYRNTFSMKKNAVGSAYFLFDFVLFYLFALTFAIKLKDN